MESKTECYQNCSVLYSVAELYTLISSYDKRTTACWFTFQCLFCLFSHYGHTVLGLLFVFLYIFLFIVVSVLVHTSTVSYVERLVIEVTNSVQSRMLNGAQSVAVC